MQEIWKYQIDATDEQKIFMPIDAKILSIHTQNDGPCMWAIGSTDAVMEERTIEIFGTGHVIPSGKRKFLGTFLVRDDSLVFHVFLRLD